MEGAGEQGLDLSARCHNLGAVPEREPSLYCSSRRSWPSLPISPRCPQISAGGKTTSLGDHDTEQEAARAFDRAAINKHGVEARTNFEVDGYAGEFEELKSEPRPCSVTLLWLSRSAPSCHIVMPSLFRPGVRAALTWLAAPRSAECLWSCSDNQRVQGRSIVICTLGGSW